MTISAFFSNFVSVPGRAAKTVSSRSSSAMVLFFTFTLHFFQNRQQVLACQRCSVIYPGAFQELGHVCVSLAKILFEQFDSFLG
mmetsp:Transcript_25721/g.67319  ORF Transcript_25721/g.67319 Transcript_25721/m.67319 type:complete len:84 (-) Transcript_25721:509-760(-)